MMSDFSVKWSENAHLGRAAGRFRIYPDHQLDLFVGYSDSGEREFILESATAALNEAVLPKFENISIIQTANSDTRSITLTLKDHQLKDLFSIICYDLVEASLRAETSVGAAQIFILRLTRWSDLMRRGVSYQISFKKRLGLLGELIALIWIIDDCEISPLVAVRAWRGPNGDRNDIGINHICIEIKSQLSTQQDLMRVSSLEQLDNGEMKLVVALYRFISAESGVSLRSLVNQVLLRLGGDFIGLMEFQRKLLLIGYQHDADYGNEAFNLVCSRFYLVENEFPRLTTATVPFGIAKAQYDIACAAIEKFRIEKTALEAMLDG